MRRLGKQALKDITAGSCILASGGGGSVTTIEPLGCHLEAKVPLADLDEVADDDWVVVSAGAFSVEKVSGDDCQEHIDRLLDAASQAFEAMQKRLGIAIQYTIAIETGIANSLFPMVTALRQGVHVIDGAGARRSMPSLTMCTFEGLPVAPIVLVDTDGQVVTVDVEKTKSAEPLMMSIVASAPFKRMASVAFWPMKGKTAKANAIPGTVTYAQRLGETLRRSRKKDPVKAVCKAVDGILLFKGQITEISEQATGLYDFSVVTLTQSSTGHSLRIYAQNESLLAWDSRLSHPVAMGPDLICYLTTDGEVFSNVDLDRLRDEKTEVAVIGAPCTRDLRQPEIVQSYLEALRTLGYGGHYVPIEMLHGQKRLAPKSRARRRAAVPHQPMHHWWRVARTEGDTGFDE